MFRHCFITVIAATLLWAALATTVYAQSSLDITWQRDIVCVVQHLGRVRLSLYNALGSEVFVLEEFVAAAGEHRFRVDAGSLPEGVYCWRVQGAADAASGVLLVRR